MAGVLCVIHMGLKGVCKRSCMQQANQTKNKGNKQQQQSKQHSSLLVSQSGSHYSVIYTIQQSTCICCQSLCLYVSSQAARQQAGRERRTIKQSVNNSSSSSSGSTTNSSNLFRGNIALLGLKMCLFFSFACLQPQENYGRSRLTFWLLAGIVINYIRHKINVQGSSLN